MTKIYMHYYTCVRYEQHNYCSRTLKHIHRQYTKIYIKHVY